MRSKSFILKSVFIALLFYQSVVNADLNDISNWFHSCWNNNKTMIVSATVVSAIIIGAYTLFRITNQPKVSTKRKDETEQLTSSVWGKNCVTKSAKLQCFKNDCIKYQNRNALIPIHKKDDRTLRVATYNVHRWENLYDQPNFDNIFANIQKINADILILQEVTWKHWDSFAKKFKNMGYFCEQNQFVETMDHWHFGNLVVSKYPITSVSTKTYDTDSTNPGEKRGYVQIVVELPHKQTLSVLGTHLDVNDAYQRSMELTELIAQAEKLGGNCLIAADFNAIRKRDYKYHSANLYVCDAVQEDYARRSENVTCELEIPETANFIDCFTYSHKPVPRFTVWTGTAVDFIYLKKNTWTLGAQNCYVYYSAESDHLPIITDINISKR